MRCCRLFGICLTVLTGGCATMVSGPKQQVTIETTPPGATVQVQDQVAVTPATLSLKRKEPCTVRVSKPGYEDGYVQLVQKDNPWVWCNCFFGIPLIPLPWGTINLLPGMIVDQDSGAAYRLSPDPVKITLQPCLDLSAGQPDESEPCHAASR